jgi:hypothetical protein
VAGPSLQEIDRLLVKCIQYVICGDRRERVQRSAVAHLSQLSLQSTKIIAESSPR